MRKVQSLDGRWTYQFPVAGTTLDALAPGEVREVGIAVPGVWESLPEWINYRGQAVAKTVFETDRSGPARFVFKGVSHTCVVYLDGKEVGAHHNAYTPFAIDLPSLSAGRHELTVWITNEFGEASALHIPNDYYTYGGISRPVELQLLETAVYIRRVRFTPRQEQGQWVADLEACLVNLSGQLCTGRLSVEVAGETWTVPQAEVAACEALLTGTLRFSGVEEWSSESPTLHLLRARFESSEGADDWIDRVGFRTVTIDGARLLVNGKPVFLMGFNRHEDHPDYGCALPVEIMRKDLELCRVMGANAIRTSHYPNDERFLDLCDELGLMVWEENHARGLYPQGVLPLMDSHPMAHPKFREQCRTCNEEMVLEHHNHPSIVLWGILNECDSYSDYGRSCYQEQFEQIKALDPSRPTTYASCHQGDARQTAVDICQDLPDVCSWNHYHTWYDTCGAAEGLRRELEKWEPKMAGKPYIVSEFGAGALPGYRAPLGRPKWSEERQADALRDCLETYLNHPRLCGAFIWQFCDVRVDEAWAMKRPRTMNNKGVVDEYRRPKLAFEVVQQLFRAAR